MQSERLDPKDPNYVAHPGRRNFLRRMGMLATGSGLAIAVGAPVYSLPKSFVKENDAREEANRRFPPPNPKDLAQANQYISQVSSDVATNKKVDIDQDRLNEAFRVRGQADVNHSERLSVREENGAVAYIIGGIGGMLGGTIVAAGGANLRVANRRRQEPQAQTVTHPRTS